MTSSGLNNTYRNEVKFIVVGLNRHSKSSYSSVDGSFVTWQLCEVVVNGLHCNYYHNVILLISCEDCCCSSRWLFLLNN